MPTSSTSTNRLVAGPYLQPLLEAAVARGVAATDLARAAALPGGTFDSLPESFPADVYERLLEIGAELTRDDNFGLHVGERVKLGTYSVYGLILLSCSNFGQALQQTLRFESLAHDLGRSSLEIDGAQAEYRWVPNNPRAGRHLVESVFAGIRVFGNWLAGAPLPPAPVRFSHVAPKDCSEHARIFGAPVTFAAEVNSARFDAALLSWPVPNADVGMYPVLQQHAENLLREKARAQADGGIVALVRDSIARNLAQDGAGLAHIAKDLRISSRTMQRKLQDAGLTFQQVLDRTRRDLAMEYLRRGQLSIAEIAFMLGYREQSSFNHAFKDWTGANPGAYRATLKFAESGD
ncbi:MAG TPA: AraC family transcriptional regulator [Burkholderiaceae bacterium]